MAYSLINPTRRNRLRRFTRLARAAPARAERQDTTSLRTNPRNASANSTSAYVTETATP